MEQMRPMGPDPATRGDGLVALPTLVHRGPGGNDAHAADRSVLFFTVVPLFDDDDEGKKIGEYDADAQIHAGWLLAHAGGVMSQEEEDTVLDSYESLGYHLRQFGKGEKVRWQKTKVKDGSAEPKRRKRKAAEATPAAEVSEAAHRASGEETEVQVSASAHPSSTADASAADDDVAEGVRAEREASGNEGSSAALHE